MQRVVWEIADRLGRSTTYDAEYIALTTLQADALVMIDEELARAAREVVALETVDALLGGPHQGHDARSWAPRQTD
jgi:predicted nucleic acid-binding protein